MLRFAFALVFLAFSSTLPAQCDTSQLHVRLVIDPDQYWQEVSWKLTNLDQSAVYAQGACVGANLQEYEYCVPKDSGCVAFRILDSHGDAMVPDGYYRLFVNDSLVRENIGINYGFGEYVTFGCATGSFCSNPIPIDTGFHTNILSPETWYSFVPVDTGIYQISTCDQGLNCPSRIWVYDQCTGILVSDDLLGTVFYAEDGCPADTNGAVANLYLAGGLTYFIRIGYAGGDCNSNPLSFELSYNGPIVGCPDPAACNYHPLATVQDTCIYPGDPDCDHLPDLTIHEGILRNSLQADFIPNADGCIVDEGCLRGFGNRFVLRFTTYIMNIGVADYYIGSPPASSTTPSDQFIWDPCHQHWHYRGYAEYVLYDSNGQLLPIGFKNGFCILDLICSGNADQKYTCANMGITAGCGDVYDVSVPCQWVDLTDLPAGAYTLVVRVNWDKSPDKTGRVESNYANNWAQACFDLQYDDQGNPSVETLDDCPQYTDCAGEVFGPAQPDCQGICNGPALQGDWNQDTLRNAADISDYIDAALQNDQTGSFCTDLDGDGDIDLYDAALLQECVLHAGEPQYWGSRFPCQFPGGVDHQADLVYLSPGTLDTVAKTFTVRILNPFNPLLGMEFNMDGLVIDSLENLVPAFGADWRFNAATGEIAALAFNEEALPKQSSATGLVRIHYQELTGPEVCIGPISNVVNKSYQRSNAQLAIPNCVPTGITGTYDPLADRLRLRLAPNPAQESCTLIAEGIASMQEVTLQDMTGRIVQQYVVEKGNRLVIERGALPPGIYLVQVYTDRGRQTMKLVWK